MKRKTGRTPAKRQRSASKDLTPRKSGAVKGGRKATLGDIVITKPVDKSSP